MRISREYPTNTAIEVSREEIENLIERYNKRYGLPSESIVRARQTKCFLVDQKILESIAICELIQQYLRMPNSYSINQYSLGKLQAKVQNPGLVGQFIIHPNNKREIYVASREHLAHELNHSFVCASFSQSDPWECHPNSNPDFRLLAEICIELLELGEQNPTANLTEILSTIKYNPNACANHTSVVFFLEAATLSQSGINPLTCSDIAEFFYNKSGLPYKTCGHELLIEMEARTPRHLFHPFWGMMNAAIGND
jgi:hypothetical protein